jgi:hypothetical protein
MADSLKKFDKPIVFAVAITLVVLGMTAVLSWGAAALGFSGPLGVLKGGVD